MTAADLYAQFAEEAFAASRADVAGECARRAVGLPAETEPGQLHAAALALINDGRFPEAETALTLALRAAPTRADWHDHLGVVLARQRRFAEAEVTFRIALRLDPGNGPTTRNLIHCLFDLRKFAAAETEIRSALTAEPEVIELTFLLVTALVEGKKVDAAATVLIDFLDRHPESAPGWNRLGVVYGSLGKLAEAERCFREEVRLTPQSGSGYANLAAALGKLGRWSEAVEVGRDAVRLAPNHALGWSNLGNALRDLGRLDEAIAASHEAIRLDPAAFEPYGNLALATAMAGRPKDSLGWYDLAVRANPDAGEVRFNRALAYLALGDFDTGFREYEWRWRTEQMRHLPRGFPAPVWDGSSLVGKSILLHTEQGIGDAIQFVRFAKVLADRGAVVYLLAAPAMHALFRTAPGVAGVFAADDAKPRYDFHCPLMSLPLVLQLRPDGIPNEVPYLTAPATAIAQWTTRLAGVTGRKVGIVWQGNPKHVGDRWRSVPLAAFAPLGAVPGVNLLSLQHGPGTEQIASTNDPKVLDYGSALASDFTDLAGLVAALDLVVAVDTAVVHLAGALGKPVWVALPLNADWRWLLGRDDSPWYPTAKLFRQTRFGEWEPVFQQMAQKLAELTDN